MLNELKKELNYTLTENGAVTNKSSLSENLDLFAQGGAFRERSDKEIIHAFERAYAEDKLTALKILFYLRDVRGGQGERRTFRLILKHLALNGDKNLEANMHLIPEFGRWDDMYEMFDTPFEQKAFDIMKAQFDKDMDTKNPSLLGKWLKSENTSSKESVRLAKKTREAFGLSPKEYRKALSLLRNRIKIVETFLSKNMVHEVEYENVPSKAMMLYRLAFYRHDKERFIEYIDSVAKGEKKINAGAIYPYDIVHNALCTRMFDENKMRAINEMWNALPDYIDGNKSNTLPVIDVSGSMTGRPMEVAISLGLYMAERNEGEFKDHFLTFSAEPSLVKITGDTPSERIRMIEMSDWGYNTDIEKVFDLILDTAVSNNIPQEEMPSRVVIISDMEFDDATSPDDTTVISYSRKKTLFDTISDKYKEAGYMLPKLVFWNVDSRNDNMPMTMNDEGVQLVSGASPSLFEAVLNDEFVNPMDIMYGVINKERYSCIKLYEEAV